MNSTQMNSQLTRLIEALGSGDSSTRLQAALAIGTHPDGPGLVEALVARCAIEPDFYVRDMLTWALTRFPAGDTVPRLLAELRSSVPQARSQSLHTLSKIGDRNVWPHDHPIVAARRRRRGREKRMAGGCRPRAGRGQGRTGG